MKPEVAYNFWANTYDLVINKTRDLEGIALKEILTEINFSQVLEIGCGTGKNTEWLEKQADKIVSVDISAEMLVNARAKITSNKVVFIQADINLDWYFGMDNSFDLVGYSLVLEHIENLRPIFQKTNKTLKVGGYLYIGELHPFKQYNGTKARFETAEGIQIVDCFDHHISDFLNLAEETGFRLEIFKEYFDDNNRNQIPRILGLLFQKK